MKLISIRSQRGSLNLPGPANDAGAHVHGLVVNSNTQMALDIYAKGWRVHVRGPIFALESPADKAGRRMLYTKAFADFDLAWELEDGEGLEPLNKWSSHDEGRKK